jgi:PAS domain S-box-containing protein
LRPNVSDQANSRERRSADGPGREGDGICMLFEGFNMVAENLSSVLITTDSRGTILFSNTEAQKAFGYSREELEGMPLKAVIPETNYDLTGDFAEGHADIFPFTERLLERRAVRKDETEFPAELDVSAWKSGGDILPLLYGTSRRGSSPSGHSKRP